MNMLRKCLAIFCTTMMIGTSSAAFANYLVVIPEQVSATHEGLFVTIDGISIAVESINVANEGYMVAIPIPSPYVAICPKCRQNTYTPGRTCSTCGFPIWDSKIAMK